MQRKPASDVSVSAAIEQRRRFLNCSGAGFAGLALNALMGRQVHGQEGAEAKDSASHEEGIAIDPAAPLRERPPMRPAKAKQVIFLFQYGGPASFDLFDYKPKLIENHEGPVPSFVRKRSGPFESIVTGCKETLLAGPWKWNQHGESGRWVSDLLPHMAKHVDKMCQIRSMTSDSSNHAPATYLINTGTILGDKPSLGSWVTYGLGSANQNLPGYVLLYDVGGFGGSANWSNAFLPAAFQGTQFRYQGAPVLNLLPDASVAATQRSTLDLTQALNQIHLQSRSHVPALEGRIASYELAYRMQSEALEIGQVESETLATQDAYGIHDNDVPKAKYGRMCLTARRLIERGVRFVQIYNAVDKFGWDGHESHIDNHQRNAMQTDQAVGALLEDLNQRGLLDSTLVIWGGEFGRTPMLQGNTGRNHNPLGFTIWMAGGGVRAGEVIGATDEIGFAAVDEPQTIKNLHATILTALGIEPDQLSHPFNGRDERLTGVARSWQRIPRVLEG
jgi:hypothetical protein